MKRLTDAEKKQIAGKIEKLRERQRTLRETNPDLPKTFEEASAHTGLIQRFLRSAVWKYGFLAVVLCLFVYNAFQFLQWKNFGSNTYLNVNLVVTLMLLFNHIALSFTKTGWKSRVMKTVAGAWIGFGLVYLFWVFR